MPLVAADHEKIRDRPKESKALLNLETLSSRTFIIVTVSFIFSLIGIIGELIFGYLFRWSCYDPCGVSVTLWPADLRVTTPTDYCGTIVSNDHVRFDLQPIQVSKWNHVMRIFVFWENQLHETHEILSTITFSLSNEAGVIAEQSSRLYSVCYAGRRDCQTTTIADFEPLWNGHLYGTVNIKDPVYGQSFTGVNDQARLIHPNPANSIIIRCQQSVYFTAISAAFRYICATLFLIFMAYYIYVCKWSTICYWIPEQYWGLAMVCFYWTYVNIFYLWLIVGDSSQAVRDFNLVMEHLVRPWLTPIQQAFEIVLLESAMGESAFICRFCYVPSFFAVLWVLVLWILDLVYFFVTGSEYSKYEPYYGAETSAAYIGYIYFWSRCTLLVMWAGWLMNNTLSAYYVLRDEPYIKTRPRQLSYRIFLWCWLPRDLVLAFFSIWPFFIQRHHYSSLLTTTHWVLETNSCVSLLYIVLVVHMYLPVTDPAGIERDLKRPKWHPLFMAARLHKFFHRSGCLLYYHLYESEKDLVVQGRGTHGASIEKGESKVRRTTSDLGEVAPGVNIVSKEDHFFCIETAFMMWNLCFEVYKVERGKIGPHRTRCAMHEVAVAPLERFQVDKENVSSRYQYLNQCAGKESRLPPGKRKGHCDDDKRKKEKAKDIVSSTKTKGRACLHKLFRRPEEEVFLDMQHITGPTTAETADDSLYYNGDDETIYPTWNTEDSTIIANPSPLASHERSPMLTSPRNSEKSEDTVLEALDVDDLQKLLQLEKERVFKKEMSAPFIDVERYGYQKIQLSTFGRYQGLVVVGPLHIGVAFRGSTEMSQWHHGDMGLASTPLHELKQKGKRPLSGLRSARVSTRMYEGWQHINQEIMDAVSETMVNHPDLKVHITGHGHGAAIAILAAYDIKHRHPDRQYVVYTFGGPRVGNDVFRDHYNKILPHTYRICDTQDKIVSIPPALFGYMYAHVGKEARVDRLGNLIVDPSFMERAFSESKSKSTAHSLVTYRRSIEAIAANNHMQLAEHVAPLGFLWVSPTDCEVHNHSTLQATD